MMIGYFMLLLGVAFAVGVFRTLKARGESAMAGVFVLAFLLGGLALAVGVTWFLAVNVHWGAPIPAWLILLWFVAAAKERKA